MRKLTLIEFYQLEPKTGSFRLQVLEKFKEIFPSREQDFIPWGNIFNDLRKQPGFTVQSKEQWEKIRRNATATKIKKKQGAAKQHFMSLWYWLYMSHNDPVASKILNDAAADLFDSILGINSDSSETVESFFLKTRSKQDDNGSKSPLKIPLHESEREYSENSTYRKLKELGKPKASRVARRREGRRFLAHGLMENYGQGLEYKFPIVTILDIDDLTIINKIHGWEVGSEIISVFEKAVELACAAHLLEREYTCGICGDDTFFFAIYSRNESSFSYVFSEFLQAVVQHDWEALSAGLTVTFSAGWAQRQHLESSLSCSQRAEAGMNEAKKSKGKNTLEAGPPMENFSPKHRRFGWS